MTENGLDESLQIYTGRSINEAPPIFKAKLKDEEIQIYEKLTAETIQEYKEVFDIFDDTGDGKISNDEIGKVMTGLGETVTKEKIDALIAEIDYDLDQHVDFQEFLCLMVKTLATAELQEEELVTVFKRFDKDKDGELNWSDIKLMFNELGYEMTDEEAQDMIHFFDTNDDSQINFEEFVQLMMYDTMDQSVQVQ